MVHKDKIQIIITDDSPPFIEGLILMLSKNQNFRILDTCSNGLKLVSNTSLSKADLLLVDIEMPEMNGLEAAKRVNYQYPNLPMIALTMYQDKVYLLDIVSSGFKAFILKPEVPQKLFEVIQLVLADKYAFPKNLKIKNDGSI